MNWLEHNCVHINCYDKSVNFSTPEEEEGLLSARQLRKLMQEEAQMFSLMASLSVETQIIIEELQVVCEFPEVFPDEIPDVPSEREVHRSFIRSRFFIVGHQHDVLIRELKIHGLVVIHSLMRQMICQCTPLDFFLGCLLDVILS